MKKNNPLHLKKQPLKPDLEQRKNKSPQKLNPHKDLLHKQIGVDKFTTAKKQPDKLHNIK